MPLFGYGLAGLGHNNEHFDRPLVLWHLVLYPVPVGSGQVRPKYRAQGQRAQYKFGMKRMAE